MSENQQKSFVLQELELLENSLATKLSEIEPQKSAENAASFFERVKSCVEELGNERHLAPRLGAVLEKVKKALLPPTTPKDDVQSAAMRRELMELMRKLALSPAMACAMYPGRNQYRHLPGALVAAVPILLPTFNNVTYLRNMIAQLIARNLRNVIVIDNASTEPDMLAYLDEVEHSVAVVKLDYNAGPRAPFLTPANYVRLPNIFCLTDPDLMFNDALPEDFLFNLIDATETLMVGKAGFAIDISQPELMSEKVLATQLSDGQRKYGLIEWESRFWQHQVAATAGGDPIYKAAIDTTFAVYNKRYFRPEAFLNAVRFAGRYTCRHLPWYKENGLDRTEEQRYRSSQKWSNSLS